MPSGTFPPKPGPGSRPSPSTPSRPVGDVRPRGRPGLPAGSGLGPPLPRPGRAGAALVETEADAAWVGWGFVAEDPAFAELCGRSASRSSGRARRRCASSATRSAPSCSPRRPGSRSRRGAVVRSRAWTPRCARRDEIGYPLMLKATAGGGGRGIRMVASAGDLTDAYERTSQEAAARVRQRRGLPGAPGHGRPARRGPGDRRRPGHGVGARRPRLLGAAAQPEGHRGVGLAGARPRAGRRAEGVGRAARGGRRTTAARAPSSSSTTPGRSCSPSSR